MKQIFSILLFFCVALVASAQSTQECLSKAVDFYKAQNYAEAVKWFRKAAEQGDAGAQCMLGFCYDNGEGVPQDYAEAVKWFRKAAEQGHAQAQISLGLCYENGEGVPQDYAEAVKWYRKAAEQGDAVAQFCLGECYSLGQGVAKDFAETVKWWRKSAEQGNADAQSKLGACYYLGRGVAKDFVEAVKWFRKAAEQGNADAQACLGECYYKGEGVPQDYAEAVKWYRKAAEQGDVDAQNNLGNRYYKGDGVPQDYAEAVKWYRKAAEQGAADAQCILGALYYYGKGVPQDHAEAVKWFRKAAEQGNADAQRNLGICYYKGQGVRQDYAEAVKWYCKSVEQGYKPAIESLNVVSHFTTEPLDSELQAMAQQVLDQMMTNPETANQFFTKIFNKVKENKELATAVGRFFVDNKVYACAKQCSNAAYAVDPTYVPGLLLAVDVNLLRNNYNGAVDKLDEIEKCIDMMGDKVTVTDKLLIGKYYTKVKNAAATTNEKIAIIQKADHYFQEYMDILPYKYEGPFFRAGLWLLDSEKPNPEALVWYVVCIRVIDTLPAEEQETGKRYKIIALSRLLMGEYTKEQQDISALKTYTKMILDLDPQNAIANQFKAALKI